MTQTQIDTFIQTCVETFDPFLAMERAGLRPESRLCEELVRKYLLNDEITERLLAKSQEIRDRANARDVEIQRDEDLNDKLLDLCTLCYRVQNLPPAPFLRIATTN